jgi:hypothetical protein
MIIQHPNGNSYLFINNRVFVSAFNETTSSVITVELDLSLPLTEWEKEQINIHIGSILPDGFWYKVVIHSYGRHSIIAFNNLQKALDYANRYYEDNGYAHLYTNNPNVNNILSGGCVYYLEDYNKLQYPYSTPSEAKLLVDSYSNQMYLLNIEEYQRQLEEDNKRALAEQNFLDSSTLDEQMYEG